MNFGQLLRDSKTCDCVRACSLRHRRPRRLHARNASNPEYFCRLYVLPRMQFTRSVRMRNCRKKPVVAQTTTGRPTATNSRPMCIQAMCTTKHIGIREKIAYLRLTVFTQVKVEIIYVCIHMLKSNAKILDIEHKHTHTRARAHRIP